MEKKTKIINLYGGPGTGKSTSAAYMYYLLKSSGKSAELIREYVKDWAWEDRKITDYNQMYFLGKQIRKESMVYGKVDWAVTDCPVLISALYSSLYCDSIVEEGVTSGARSFYKKAEKDGYKHYHIFLKRTKQYNPDGRYQTEKEAIEIDNKMKAYLKSFGCDIIELDTSEESLKTFINDLVI
jgi:nicotinamide riboside kinase